MNRTADVIVVGAGLHGCSAGLWLAARGLSVIVLEKDRGGRNSSAINAGGVRRAFRDLAELPLAMKAHEYWRSIEDLVGSDCGYVASGQLYIAETDAELAIARQHAVAAAAIGFDEERVIGPEDVREFVPSLAPIAAGGLYVADDGFASPWKTTRAFQVRIREMGVPMIEDSPITKVRRQGNTWHIDAGEETFEAPVVINCAGAWGGIVAAMLGDGLPLNAEAPSMMVTSAIAPFVRPVVGSIGRKLSFKQAPNGIVLIGGGYRGTLDLATSRAKVDFGALSRCARTVIDYFPHIAGVPIVRAWAGIEGLTPDRVPYIGPGRERGVFHSFGYSSHGFQLAPVSGQAIADLVCHGDTNLPIAALSPDRFMTASGSGATQAILKHNIL